MYIYVYAYIYIFFFEGGDISPKVKPRHAAGVWQLVRHVVAACYASTEHYASTPAGYRYLTHCFPHPNVTKRHRSLLARDLVEQMPCTATRFFSLIVWRFHNTPEAYAALAPLLASFGKERDVAALRDAISRAYSAHSSVSYLFSTGDGIRGTGGATWKEAVLTNLDAWWLAAQLAAAKLDETGCSAEGWHAYFLGVVIPAMNLSTTLTKYVCIYIYIHM